MRTVISGKKILLIGGLGHTDLSGKVPRPGLLMLRKALRLAGHDAVVANYSTRLMDQMFPPQYVARLRRIYDQTVRPLVIERKNPLFRPWTIPKIIRQMRELRTIAAELQGLERSVYQDLAYEIAQRVREENFNAIGFSLFLGGSTIAALVMTDIIRNEHPALPIFFGGPQTTHFAETIYEETSGPTALVLGEGEEAIVELANRLDDLRQGKSCALDQVPNIVFRAQDGKIIATARKRLPLAQWLKLSAVPYEPDDFAGLLRYAFIETSRGCQFLCNFCPEPLLSGTYRYLKPAARIVDEMQALNERFGLTHFELIGSTTSPRQASELADEIINRGLADLYSWVLFMRGKDTGKSQIDYPSLMSKMRTAGAQAVFFGVEAADNETLKRMGKKEAIEDIEAAIKAAQAAGLKTIASFIYPYPGMAANEAELIMDFLKRVAPMSAPVQMLGLYPGTYAADHAEELGCEVIYPDPADQSAYLAGKKDKPSMKSPEVLRYLLKYPLILSLPLRFWSPLPYKINGQAFRQNVKAVTGLHRKIAALGILLGFSHTHYLISRILGVTPGELSEQMFYASLTGDPEATRRIIDRFNERVIPPDERVFSTTS